MDADTIIGFGVVILCCLLVVLVSHWIERRWRRMHPPDDWDGCREDKDEHV